MTHDGGNKGIIGVGRFYEFVQSQEDYGDQHSDLSSNERITHHAASLLMVSIDQF